MAQRIKIYQPFATEPALVSRVSSGFGLFMGLVNINIEYCHTYLECCPRSPL